MLRFRSPLRTLGAIALVLVVGRPSIAVGTPAPSAPAAERPTPAAAPTPPPPLERSYNFQLVLVLADNGAAPAAESLPARAQRALDDAREFLPYKSYRLIDTAWLRTSRSAHAELNGPAGETIRLGLDMDEASAGQLFIRRFELVQMAMMPPPGASAMTSPEQRRTRELLGTSFGMAVGETVVVGTAKLDGPGKALIAILSAVP